MDHVHPCPHLTGPLTVSLRQALAEVLCRYDLPDLAGRVLDVDDRQDVRAALNGHRYDIEDCLDFSPQAARQLVSQLEALHQQVTVPQQEPETCGLRSVDLGGFRLCALHDGWLVTRNGGAIGLMPAATAVMSIAKTEFGLLHDPVPCDATLTEEALLVGTDALPLRRLMVTPGGVLDVETGHSYLLAPQDLAGITAQRQRLLAT